MFFIAKRPGRPPSSLPLTRYPGTFLNYTTVDNFIDQIGENWHHKKRNAIDFFHVDLAVCNHEFSSSNTDYFRFFYGNHHVVCEWRPFDRFLSGCLFFPLLLPHKVRLLVCWLAVIRTDILALFLILERTPLVFKH